MSARLPRFATARAVLAGIVALAAGVAACDTRLPTAAEIEAMDAEAIETLTSHLALIEFQKLRAADGDRDVHVVVDGKETTMAEFRDLVAEEIAYVAVVRARDAQPARILVETLRPRDELAISEVSQMVPLRGSATVAGNTAPLESTDPGEGDDVEGSGYTLRLGGELNLGDGPLFLIDGVVADPGALRRLARDRIERIDVLKGAAGAAAAEAYDNPRAANGVVRITTRGADGTPQH